MSDDTIGWMIWTVPFSLKDNEGSAKFKGEMKKKVASTLAPYPFDEPCSFNPSAMMVFKNEEEAKDVADSMNVVNRSEPVYHVPRKVKIVFDEEAE